MRQSSEEQERRPREDQKKRESQLVMQPRRRGRWSLEEEFEQSFQELTRSERPPLEEPSRYGV